ncbi:hypothetical protein BG011_002670 [Mortierella polycephala]|uniref:Crinkler effector protein N-terminal domain-containing protein n=1 Tax=Mortierella polycephala TaxID=41804 RepID=A0A9P6PKE2_9FUNG|nr:hypothetical protein BG011_002670 [Mortierella polycephala]
MTNNGVTLFCLVDGESAPFPVKVESTETIKTALSPQFDDVTAKDLALSKVSITIADDDDNDDDDLLILLNNIPKNDKKKLKAVANKVSDVFDNEPDENMILVIVQRPPSSPTPRSDDFSS